MRFFYYNILFFFTINQTITSLCDYYIKNLDFYLAYRNCFLLLYKDLYPKFKDKNTVAQTEVQIAIIIAI